MRYFTLPFRSVFASREQSINLLLERCQLDYDDDDLLLKVSILLQLPLRRVSEYHDSIERVQLLLDVCLLDMSTYALVCLLVQTRIVCHVSLGWWCS